jgi:hypothetical protein
LIQFVKSNNLVVPEKIAGKITQCNVFQNSVIVISEINRFLTLTFGDVKPDLDFFFHFALLTAAMSFFRFCLEKSQSSIRVPGTALASSRANILDGSRLPENTILINDRSTFMRFASWLWFIVFYPLSTVYSKSHYLSRKKNSGEYRYFGNKKKPPLSQGA